MKKAIILNRVSTSQQSTERQLRDMTDVCEKKGWDVVKVFDEVGSGYKNNEEREILNGMINFCKSNDANMVVVSELSRLGRKTSEVLSLINTLNDNQISLYIHMNKLETLDDDKQPNPLTMFMLSILSSVNQMEKDITLNRMNSGRRNYIKNGGKVGRKKGSVMTDEELLVKHSDVVKLLKKGISIRNTSSITEKSVFTIQKVKKTMDKVG